MSSAIRTCSGVSSKGESWKAWRFFLAALFTSPPDDEITLYRACTERTAWPTFAFTEAAVVVRQHSRKSHILALIAVYLATMRDYCDSRGGRGGDDRGARGRSIAGAGRFRS